MMSFENILNKIAIGSNPPCKIQELYGTDYFSTFLKSYCQMTRPKCVVELGVGFGTTMLRIGDALKQNKTGMLYCYDNGQDWYKLKEIAEDAFSKDMSKFEYDRFINFLIKKYQFRDIIKFQLTDVRNELPKVNGLISILFCDSLSADIETTTKYLSHYLLYMEDYSSIFIDGAATRHEVWLYLLNVIDTFNRGSIPKHILDRCKRKNQKKLIKKIRRLRFQLIPLTEPKKESAVHQNSRAWIRIEPLDTYHHNNVENYLP